MLNALTDAFMSPSVIKIRAGIPGTERSAGTLKACFELESRGLAIRAGSGRRSTLRWRRAPPQRERGGSSDAGHGSPA